jgi:hypothetical protein
MEEEIISSTIDYYLLVWWRWGVGGGEGWEGDE